MAADQQDINKLCFALKCRDAVALAYEAKLEELMPKDEYKAFTAKVAKDIFRAQINALEDCDFKKFALDNFDEITSQGENDEP